ncbi:hypothetical protein ABH926_007967 [Catenulispora sp. GP43]
MNTARKDGVMNDTDRDGLQPTTDGVQPANTDHRLRWPEAVAITLALVLCGAAATGVFRPMLPWLG